MATGAMPVRIRNTLSTALENSHSETLQLHEYLLPLREFVGFKTLLLKFLVEVFRELGILAVIHGAVDDAGNLLPEGIL